MVRFIKIGDQISLLGNLGNGVWHDFAWFDTVTDTFMEFDGEQAWGSWSAFVDSYKDDNPYGEEMYPLERFKGLFQEDF